MLTRICKAVTPGDKMYKFRKKRFLIICGLVLVWLVIKRLGGFSFRGIDIWTWPVFAYFNRHLTEPEMVFSLGICLFSMLLLAKEIIRK